MPKVKMANLSPQKKTIFIKNCYSEETHADVTWIV